MGKFFDLDSPIMNFFSKMADLIGLNILAFICCLPIVTVGASMTALHYVCLKIVRDEEGYIVKSFFKSFKQNFKQATIIWLIWLAVMLIFVGDLLIFMYSGIEFPGWLKVVFLAVVLLSIFATMHVFPILSRFENTVAHTYKNSLLMGVLAFPKTLLMMVMWVVPALVAVFIPPLTPIALCLGISGPAFISALLYNGTFKRFEPQEEEASDEWFIEPEEEQEAVESVTEEEMTEE